MKLAWPQPCYPVYAELIRSRATALCIAGIGAAQLATIHLGVHLPCPLHATTGIPCPGCGLTRSVTSLLHGHIGESLAWHPLGPMLLVGLLFALVAALLPAKPRDAFSNLLARVESRTWITIFLFGLLVLLWIMRVAHLPPLRAV